MSRVSHVGAQIAALRKARGLTLAGLAELSRISRAAISALENGNANPTVETLWSLADALGVEFGALLDGRSELQIPGGDGATVRLIKRTPSPQVVEAFQLDILAGSIRHARAHPPGVWEHVMVLSGTLLVGPTNSPTRLGAGQALRFRGDIPHLYQAGPENCSTIVTVVYPPDDAPSTPVDQQLSWPNTDEDWQGLRDLVERAKTEVRNGCTLARLTFPETASSVSLLPLVEAAQTGRRRDDPAHVFVCNYGSPSLIVVHRDRDVEKLARSSLKGPLIERCRDLADLAGPSPRDDLRRARQSLETSAQNAETMIEATLAAEVLTRHLQPTVPAQSRRPSPHRTVSKNSQNGQRVFEDRIDVNAYEAYELVHPAYARQTLAVAEALPPLPAEGGDNLVDVGTGPGLPLQMLLELRPEIRSVAIDPSPIAFAHLSTRFAGDPRVRPLQASVDAYKPDRLVPAMVSIGASHHLDTLTFLESCRSCLSPDGTLIVADEMLPPFRDARTRTAALLSHHLWYILDTLVRLPEAANDTEIAVAETLSNRLPVAMAMALTDCVPAAARMVRSTYQELASCALPARPSVDLAVFSRFHLLELQALVAGLDYEVEQKTHPLQFLALARRAGFRCEQHQRIYATAGAAAYDGGTHLFVLRPS